MILEESQILFSVTAKTELKWRVDDPTTDFTCECDDDCEHSIKPDELDTLKDGLMINALWPFNGNHYYPARIVRVFFSTSFLIEISFVDKFCFEEPVKFFSSICTGSQIKISEKK